MIRLLEWTAGICLLAAFWLCIFYLTQPETIRRSLFALCCAGVTLVVVVWWFERLSRGS